MARHCAIAILVVLTVAPALAQPGLVRGKVTDEKGAPVRDAVATFQVEGSQTQREARTDAKGEFLLVGLDTARYKITIAKEGFVPDVVTAGIARENNPLLEFRLTSSKAASSKAAIVSEGPAIPVNAAVAAAAADAKAAAALLALAKTAVEALNAGRNDEAVTAFTEIVASAPACSDCYVNLGIAHVNKTEYPQAEAAFKKAIQIKTDHAEAYERLASVYSAQKKFELAADANRNAAALSGGASAAAGGGGNFAALYNQGVALFNGGKFAEAKAAFEAATKADPKMAMAQYHLGIAAVNVGDFALAVRAFERYLQLDANGEKAAEIKASLPALKGMVKK